MPFKPWTPLPTERDLLIEEVKYDKLTPEQAGKEAKRLGLEPFEFSPDLADFDPMKEPTWSLIMALAWVMWRTPDAVRDMWDHYRQKFRFWVFYNNWQVPGEPGHTGHFLEAKNRAELLDLAIRAAEDRPPRTGAGNSSEAFVLLGKEAQRAKWRATGIPTGGGPRREILPFEWHDFRIFETIRGMNVRTTQDTGYEIVRVPVAGLVKESFPPRGACTRPAASKKRRRGDFPRVESAVNAVYPKEIPKSLSDADVVRKVASHIKATGGTVPTDRTLHTHISEIRGTS